MHISTFKLSKCQAESSVMLLSINFINPLTADSKCANFHLLASGTLQVSGLPGNLCLKGIENGNPSLKDCNNEAEYSFHNDGMYRPCLLEEALPAIFQKMTLFPCPVLTGGCLGNFLC